MKPANPAFSTAATESNREKRTEIDGRNGMMKKLYTIPNMDMKLAQIIADRFR